MTSLNGPCSDKRHKTRHAASLQHTIAVLTLPWVIKKFHIAHPRQLHNDIKHPFIQIKVPCIISPHNLAIITSWKVQHCCQHICWRILFSKTLTGMKMSPKKETMGVSERWRKGKYNCANSLPSNTISIYSRMIELHSELNLKI